VSGENAENEIAVRTIHSGSFPDISSPAFSVIQFGNTDRKCKCVCKSNQIKSLTLLFETERYKVQHLIRRTALYRL